MAPMHQASGGAPTSPPAAAIAGELTYETLVDLEDVKITAPLHTVDALPVEPYDNDVHGGRECPICLECYVEGDTLLSLPCGHVMHNAPCGREYLLHWNKRCPECKHSATGD